jgi:hypothetical protein
MTALAMRGWMAELSQAATGSLLAAVWQGVLLATVAGLVLRLLPKTPAAVRFAIWFGVFLAVTALPLASLSHSGGGPQPGGRGPWLILDARWSLAIAMVWAAASLVRAATLVLAALRVRALWRHATPVETGGNSTEGASKIGRRAQLCVSDDVDRPTVIGFFSPKILLPKWLLERLTSAELEQVVLHEVSHLSRADDWLNLLQKIALVIFPLNPALAWIERRLCFERELACDERVLGATDAPKAYAACLATLAEYRLERRGLGLALALGALGRESELGRRVGRILRRRERMKPLHAKLVLGGVMLGLLGAAAGLEHCPPLVGFSTGHLTAESYAAGNMQQGTATRGDRRYSYQPVVFRQSAAILPAAANAGIQAAPGDSHKGRAAAQPSRTNRNPGAPFMAVSSPWVGSRRADDALVQPDSAQWVMVTAWERADGSRVVMTSAALAPRAMPPLEQDSDQQPQTLPHVHPYAAVPVRGGWLIFQL